MVESRAISSSVSPSAKYASFGSGLIFRNGSTAIRFLSRLILSVSLFFEEAGSCTN